MVRASQASNEASPIFNQGSLFMSISQPFGPKMPYEENDPWAQELEKSTDTYNATYNKREQDIANLQASVNDMYSHLTGGKDDYWSAILCGMLLVEFGTMTKAQDDNDLAMEGEDSSSAAGGLMSSVTELWSNGQSTTDGGTTGMTEEEGKQLFMEQSDFWYFLHAPSYNDSGKSMSWFWDPALKDQISTAMSDSLTYFLVLANPDENLPLRDGDLDKTAAQIQTSTNAMWYNEGKTGGGQPPSQQVTTVLNDFQMETTSANSVQTGFNSEYQTTVNTINSIMSGISDGLNNIMDLNTLSTRYMAPK